MKRFAILLLLILSLCACGSGASVKFKNQSNHELQSVEISGSGFKASLRDIAPGQSRTVKVYPSGESALSVSFVANGQGYRSEPQGYFEGGGMYKVSVVVSRDLTVLVDTSIWP